MVADDRSTASIGWKGFSAPIIPSPGNSATMQKSLGEDNTFYGADFSSWFTFCALAISRGVRGTIKLGLVTLAGIAIPGYMMFFVYVLSAKTGLIISATLPYLFGALLLLLLFRLRRGTGGRSCHFQIRWRDRPPLQAGTALVSRGVGGDSQLMDFPVWSLLRTFRISKIDDIDGDRQHISERVHYRQYPLCLA
jgi:hypothetical protein